MGDVYFYHLTRAPLEAVLPVLLERALGAGWRVVVRGVNDARMAWLDERLWLGPEERFLAHGLAGGEHDADQRVLLTAATDATNGAACLMAVDGAAVSAEDVRALARVCVLFDGNDEAALGVARGQWRDLTGAGCKAQYWSQQSGKWEKVAQS